MINHNLLYAFILISFFNHIEQVLVNVFRSPSSLCKNPNKIKDKHKTSYN